MQGAQSTGSWNLGLGRYTMFHLPLCGSLATAVSMKLSCMNGAFPELYARVRAHFRKLYTPEMYSYLGILLGLRLERMLANYWRCQASELIREAFSVSLKPE